MDFAKSYLKKGGFLAVLSSLISPAFFQVHKCIKLNLYTHFWLKGGRGSTKSSFISIEIILGLMRDENVNAVVLRKVGNTLKDSVYEQLAWAIDILGVSKYWTTKISPLEFQYTNQNKIIFRGADNPKKIKSTKFKKGYCKYVWFEEVDEFKGIEEIRTINQSLLRGGKNFCVFYSYNPPQSQRNWVNEEVLNIRDDTLVHHSNYLDVPRNWLGEQFFIEANHLKEINETAYKHEYLGEVTGTGGEVFKNIKVKAISEQQINSFERLNRGIDWGYSIDPFAYTVNYYDKTRRILYIFFEIYVVELSNLKAAQMVKKENKFNKIIICDSAEPKSIAEFNSYGINVMGAKKGRDSVDYGIKFLQDLEQIIIDPVRCPNTVNEFLNYELEKDNNGNWRALFPDKNNHLIDATRYSLQFYMQNAKVR